MFYCIDLQIFETCKIYRNMEQIKLKQETYNKIVDYKKEHPDCKNLDDALGCLLLDLENEVKIQTEEKTRFQNGLHDKNNQLEKKQQEINSLIEKGTNGTHEQAEQINRLSDEINKREKENSELKSINENLENQLREHVAKNDSLNEQLAALQNEQNENGRESTSYQLKIDALKEENDTLKATLQAYENTENDSEIKLLEPTKQILDLVAKKLSERYKQQITQNDIVNKMILRYNVERWTAWFHPFVVTDSEIQEITGKTVDELKRFFNNAK